MRLWSRTFLLGIAATLMMASGTAAVTVHDVVRTGFDPSANDVLLGYGSGGYYLTYAPIDGGTGLFDPTGAPGSTGTFQGNPPWLDFFLNSSGSTSGTGGPGGPGGGAAFTNSLSYTLQTRNGSLSFDFSVLFYNPLYDAAVDDATNVAQIILTGSDGTKVDSAGGNEALVTAGELRAGIMLTWSIEADAGVDLNVVINALGVGAYAAGFFLDNVDQLPEPATLGLLAVGLGGLILRRRRDRSDAF